jgi:hypothetical protein
MTYPYSKIYQKQHTHTTLVIQTGVVVWGENKIKNTQNVTSNSCSHVFTHKCKKVK